MNRRVVRLVLIAFCLAALSLSVRAQTSPQPDAQWKALDGYIQKERLKWKVPGLAVGIVQNGQPVYVKGFGFSDSTTTEPLTPKTHWVTPNTLFDIGSCTKAFTSAAAGILVDEGKMQWDAHVDTYIPFFHLYDPLADENVTMRDLLTHRTGLSGGDLLWYGSPFSLEQIIRRVRYLKPAFGFRSRFDYNNVMYATAGYAVGEASGGTWQDFVRTRIFAPLGMTGADFSAIDAQKAPDYATPFELKDGKAVRIPWRNIDNVAPAGSINAGVGDITKWIAMQLNGGMADGRQIVSAKSLQETHTPQIVVPHVAEFDQFFPESQQLSYGMGWFIQDYRGHQIWLHPGDIDGFASLVVLIPEVKTGFVILTNLDHNPVREGLGYHLIDEFLNLPDQDWPAHFADVIKGFSAMEEKAQKAEETPKNPNTHPSHDLPAYAGTYRNQAYGDVVVSLAADQLQLKFNSLSGALKPFQYDTFMADLAGMGKMRVMFALDEAGDVAKLTLAGIDFTRVPTGASAAAAAH